MATYLAQNQFMSSAADVPSAVGSAGAPPQPPVAPAGTTTNATSFLHDPIQSSCGDRGKHHGFTDQAKPGLQAGDAGVASSPQEAESSSSTGGYQEAPAPRCTDQPDGVGALEKCNCAYSLCDDFDRPDCKAKAAGLDPWPDGPTDHIPEIFHWVRKLLKDAPAFVLDEARFLADIDEEPLFLREDGYLQRREA
jgi:hypothetical protein